MTDWKSALAALASTEQTDNDSTSAANGSGKPAADGSGKPAADGSSKPAADDKKDVERKKRVGVVYSTNPDFGYEDGESDQPQTLPHNQQRLRLNMERAGHGGKTVTMIKGFVGTDEDLNALCKLLKQRCGVGGAVKEGEIIIQGDHKSRLIDLLKKEGYTQTK